MHRSIDPARRSRLRHNRDILFPSTASTPMHGQKINVIGYTINSVSSCLLLKVYDGYI